MAKTKTVFTKLFLAQFKQSVTFTNEEGNNSVTTQDATRLIWAVNEEDAKKKLMDDLSSRRKELGATGITYTSLILTEAIE